MIQKLYKYMPLRENFLQNRLLRATGRAALNDPFEASPSADYFADLCRQTGHTRFGESENEVVQYIQGQAFDSPWAQLGMDKFNEHGVVSLTESCDNLLMWAHYGDRHRGMAIEFDPGHEFFNSTYTDRQHDHVGKLQRVLYRKERLKRFRNFSEPYFHKSDEWMHEKEHRLLLPLSHAKKRLICERDLESLSIAGAIEDPNTKKFARGLLEIESCTFEGSLIRLPEVMFMFEVPAKAITGVIIGGAVPEHSRNAFREKFINAPELAHVDWRFAQISADRFEVKTIEI